MMCESTNPQIKYTSFQKFVNQVSAISRLVDLRCKVGTIMQSQ